MVTVATLTCTEHKQQHGYKVKQKQRKINQWECQISELPEDDCFPVK